MNTRRNINWKAVLGLGLFTALATGGLLVSRRNQEADAPAPTPEQAQVGKSSAVAQPVMNRVSPEPSALQPAAAPNPDELRTMSPILNESGYESPFTSTNQAPVNTSATQTDPEKLRAALNAAIASGSVRDIAALLHSGNPASEIEAVRMLAQIGGGDALAAALGKLLTVPEDSPDYKKFINAFADCHSPAVANWLTGALGQAKTEEMRQRVLTLLAALRGPEVIDSLAAALASPIDAMHAKDCAELLAKSSDPEQAAILRDLLATGNTTEIQTLAASGLAHVGSREACAALIETGASSEATAEAARKALATVSSSYGQEALIQAAINPAIPYAVRYAAVQALSTQPGQRTQTALINLAQADSDPALQTAISQTLQTIEQSGTSPHPGSALGDAGENGEIWF